MKAPLYKKQFYTFFFLCTLSLLIWYAGPSFTLLKTPEQRWYIIAIFYLAWILKFFLLDLLPSDASAQASEKDKKIAHLKGKIQGAILFLKKTTIVKHGKKITLAKLPWGLLIGPKSAGKTTLLAKSGIHYILAKQNKDMTILPSESCDFWVTRDLVLVDIPGSYQNIKKNTTDLPRLWHYLLKLIKNFHRYQSPPKIVVALNLPELIKEERSKKNQVVYDLKKHLIDLCHTFQKPMVMHIVITKCDLLPGFNEYFSECSRDELSQAWGIDIPPLSPNEKLTEVYTERFNALIKRLNSQLISRLHLERNGEMRSLIKDFPLHIERLKESIAQLIKALALPNLHLQSVHLTSALQEYKEEHLSYISESSSHGLQLMSAPPPSRVYFIRQLLLHHLTPVYSELQQTAWNVGKKMIIGTAVILILLTGLWVIHDFNYSIQKTYLIQNSLANYQQNRNTHPSQEHLTMALPLLNTLQKAALYPSGAPYTFYWKTSQERAETLYRQALQSIIFPEIKQVFENYLQKASDKNPEQVYAVLKAYLMLGDTTHFDANYIAAMLQTLIPLNSNETLAQLTSHINAALKITPWTLQPNFELVTAIREHLQHLSQSTLGFVLLKNMENNNIDSLVSLGTQLGDPPLFTIHAVTPEIPSMYTANAFLKMTQVEVKTAAIEVIKGNWVLGENPHFADGRTINALEAELRTEYITHYVDIWESLLANLSLKNPKNLLQVTQMVAALTGSNSPLLQVLDTIKQNTAFAPIKAASPKLQNLSILLENANNNQSSLLYQVFVSLQSLNTYLQNFMNAKDQQSALFAATVKRMQPTNDPIDSLLFIASETPEPLKTWLMTLGMKTWEFMLNDTGAYIENNWEKSIFPVYQNALAHRYPFDQKSAQEVELSQFITFLGEPGLLNSFFQAYLKPFVIMDKKWEWRRINTLTLPFSTTALTAIQEANKIQRAFFPNGDNKLYVPFTLQPIALDKKARSFTLNINGQEIQYRKNKGGLISWPGKNSRFASSLNFVSLNNQLLQATAEGEWGWFRLVSGAIKNIKSRKEIELVFAVNDHKAKYILLTDSHLNPFLPLNFERFKLPLSWMEEKHLSS